MGPLTEQVLAHADEGGGRLILVQPPLDRCTAFSLSLQRCTERPLQMQGDRPSVRMDHLTSGHRRMQACTPDSRLQPWCHPTYNLL